MLFVMSVHFRRAEWVALQRRYLDQYLDVEHRRLFEAEGIPQDAFTGKEEVFSYSGSHAQALDNLAARALQEAAHGDFFLFIDSDALPVAPISQAIGLAVPLVSVRRGENNGDRQPHPCFTVSTAEFWRHLPGTWGSGYRWRNRSLHRVTDVGGNLLQRLQEKQQGWQPIERLNHGGVHPLWFGLYGIQGMSPLVYHHGAGSRTRKSRIDAREQRQVPWKRRRLRRKRLEWLLADNRWRHLGLPRRPTELPDPEAFSAALTRRIPMGDQFWRWLL